MSRLCNAAVIVGALYVALAAPRLAHASDSDAAARAALPATAVAGACTEASEIFSARVLGLEPEAAAPASESPVPWCVSPDDPRCSPIEGGSLPPQASAQAKLSVHTLSALGGLTGRECNTLPPMAAMGEMRCGAHLRFERPPRVGA